MMSLVANWGTLNFSIMIIMTYVNVISNIVKRIKQSNLNELKSTLKLVIDTSN